MARVPRGAVPLSLAAGLLVLVLAAGVAFTLPLNTGPDEPPVVRYARFLEARQRLPDPRRDDIFQAQHPPLYHAWLAAWIAAAPEFGDGPGHPRLRLPYERTVRIRWDLQGDPQARDILRRAREAGTTPGVARWPYLLRLSGLILAAVVLALAFRGAAALGGIQGLLAVASLVLLPQVAATFATPGNDQMLILWCTAALGILMAGATSRRRQAAASVLFGLGFLTKLTALGPFVTGLVLAASQGRPRPREILKRWGLLALGPLLLAGWWVLRQLLLTGSPHALDLAAARHPEMLRGTPPDLWEQLATLGGYLRSVTGIVGADGASPGTFWFAGAALVPLLVAGSVLALSLGRRVPGPQRVLARALLAGLVVQTGALLLGNRHFLYVHGRYFLPFLLPAGLVAAAGAGRLAGSRAPALLGVLAVVAAAGGPWLLHGVLIPHNHPRPDPERIPRCLTYLDLGREHLVQPVLDGSSREGWPPEPADADQRLRLDLPDQHGDIRLRLPAGSPGCLLWVRLAPPHKVLGPDHLAHVGLQAPPASPLAGWLSSHARRRHWTPLALAPPQDGGRWDVAVSGAGKDCGISQVLVQRLPWRIGTPRREKEHVVVPVSVEPPLLGLGGRAWLVSGDGEHDIRSMCPLPARSTELVFPLPVPASGPWQVDLESPGHVLLDVKLAARACRPEPLAGRLVRQEGSPGLLALQVRPGRDTGGLLARVPGEALVPGLKLRLVAGDGRTLDPAGFKLRRGAGPLPRSGRGWQLPPDGPQEALEIHFQGRHPVVVDRLVGTGSLWWRSAASRQ